MAGRGDERTSHAVFPGVLCEKAGEGGFFEVPNVTALRTSEDGFTEQRVGGGTGRGRSVGSSREGGKRGAARMGAEPVEHLSPPVVLNPELASPVSCWDAPCCSPRSPVPLWSWGHAGGGLAQVDCPHGTMPAPPAAGGSQGWVGSPPVCHHHTWLGTGEVKP